jgi:hypothetical protein
LGKLLHVDSRQTPPLIILRVSVVFEIRAVQPSAVGETEDVSLLGITRRIAIHPYRRGDGILEILPASPDDKPDSVRAVVFRVTPEFP